MSLLELVAAEIESEGPISFSRYMEWALYHPELGFYAHGGAGRRRDFITSPEVGPLFGAVMARALDTWWDELGEPENFVFVDAGAGPAMLARTIVRAQPRCLDALEYVAVDVSPSQLQRQPDGVTSLSQLPERVEFGVIFANELLDNLPFDLGEYSAVDGWQNVLVGLGPNGLGEVFEAMSNPPPVPEVGSDKVIRIPLQRQATEWLEGGLQALVRGRVVIIDYAVDCYPTEPGREWLRTYSQHDHAGSPLEDPGGKDITTDVDLASLERVRAPDFSGSQRDWLEHHGINRLVAEGQAYWDAHAAAPDVTAIEMRSRVSEAKALLDPAGLGGFSALEWVVAQ